MSDDESLDAARKPYRVLSLDGGGMRGVYTATYLDEVARGFAKKRGVGALDVGKAFDLIVGTSTGGIIACALAAGVALADVVDLYRVHGPAIFRRRLPDSRTKTGLLAKLVSDIRNRPDALAKGTKALEEALAEHLKEMTVGEVWTRRGIALGITAVEMSQHRSWVFKTPHLVATTKARDDDYRLVDVCLATSAAPIYRSMAPIDVPGRDGRAGFNVFVDGGLWANNPVLVGLIDALEVTAPGQAIQILCLGTCPRPAGEQVPKGAVDRGLPGWKFGGHAAGLSVDAQEFAYDNMARMLAKHVDRSCEIIRFPADKVPASVMPFLELDDTREEAMDALIRQARTDADMTNSRCGDPNSREGRIISAVFGDAPVLDARTPDGGQ